MIKINNLTKIYKKTLFENLSFCIFDTGIIQIKGASGSGKTTLLKILLGVETPNFGDVIFDENGSIVASSTARKELISFLPNENILFDEYSLLQNIKIFKDELNIGINEKLLEDTLKYFNIEKLSNKKLSNCSGGEQKLLNLSFSISRQAKYVFLDEPFAELSRQNKEKLHNLINNISTTKSVVIISHDKNYLFKKATVINLDKLDKNAAEPEYFAKKLSKTKHSDTSKFSLKKFFFSFKKHIKNNVLPNLILSFVLLLSSVSLCFGICLKNPSWNSTQETIKIYDPYDYLKLKPILVNSDSISDYYFRFDEFINHKNFNGFYAINLCKNDIFISNKINEVNTSLSKTSASNIEIIFDNFIDNDFIYYEIDNQFLNSNPLISLNEIQSLKFKISNKYRYETNKSYFLEQSYHRDFIDKEIYTRTDRIYCSFKNAPLLFNNLLFNEIKTYDGLVLNQPLLSSIKNLNSGLNLIKNLKVSVTDEDNIFGLKGYDANELKAYKEDFILNQNSSFLNSKKDFFDYSYTSVGGNFIYSTADLESYNSNTLYISLNNIFEFLSGNEAGAFFLKNDTSTALIENDFNIVYYSPVFSSYSSNQGYIGNILLIIGICFLFISLTLLFIIGITIIKRKKINQRLLYLGINKKEVFASHFLYYIFTFAINFIISFASLMIIWNGVSHLTYSNKFGMLNEKNFLYFVGRESLYNEINSVVFVPYDAYKILLLIILAFLLFLGILFFIIKKGLKNVRD